MNIDIEKELSLLEKQRETLKKQMIAINAIINYLESKQEKKT